MGFHICIVAGGKDKLGLSCAKLDLQDFLLFNLIGGFKFVFVKHWPNQLFFPFFFFLQKTSIY